jgi:predicted MPP superfamily phosphohydrolase
MKLVPDRLASWIPDFFLFAFALLAQAVVVVRMLRRARNRASRRAVRVFFAISSCAMAFGFVLRSFRFAAIFQGNWPIWARALCFAWMLVALCWAIIYAALQLARRIARRSAVRDGSGIDFERRGFLRAVGGVLYAAPVAALGYAMVMERRNISLREHEIPIAGLPVDLDGLRLVQITDIHMSAFFSRRQLDYAVALANETHAHVALVTGDLISSARDPLDSCLEGLKALRAEAGVFGCMGNHEIYARVENRLEKAGALQGLRFLRRANTILPFGAARLNLAGVDYQRLGRRYLVGAEKLVVPGACNILLSHNPDVFDVAARQGYDLTISGHTHGGQVRVEILGADLNVARFYTPYVDGLYRKGGAGSEGAAIFVSRGLGTIGIPARLGAPPEVTLLRLRRV